MARRLLARTSVRDALDSAVIALGAAGCDTPRLDAELLLAHVLGVDRAALITGAERGLEPDEARAFMDFAARRREREPVAYILGSKGFRTIELAVDARVLVPRPETEHVVEAALELPAGARVVDVGTGSGAIALALKAERPDLEVLATEISPAALEVARGNAARLGLEVELLLGDLLEPVTGQLGAVVCQPALRRHGRRARARGRPPRAARGAIRRRGRPRRDPTSRHGGEGRPVPGARGRRGPSAAGGRAAPAGRVARGLDGP